MRVSKNVTYSFNKLSLIQLKEFPHVYLNKKEAFKFVKWFLKYQNRLHRMGKQ